MERAKIKLDSKIEREKSQRAAKIERAKIQRAECCHDIITVGSTLALVGGIIGVAGNAALGKKDDAYASGAVAVVGAIGLACEYHKDPSRTKTLVRRTLAAPFLLCGHILEAASDLEGGESQFSANNNAQRGVEGESQFSANNNAQRGVGDLGR